MKKSIILFIVVILFSLEGLSQNYCDTVQLETGLPDTLINCGTSSLSLSANNGFLSYEWSNGNEGNALLAKYSGIYWLTVTNDSSCIAVDSVYISLIDAQINQSDTFLCSSQILQFDLSTNHENSASLNLNGNGGFAIATDELLPAGNLPRSLEFWVYNEGQTNESDVISYGTTSTGNGLKISIDQNDSLRLTLNQSTYICENIIAQNTWTHVIVYTDPAQKYGFVIDGILAGTASITGTFNTVLNDTLLIGSSSTISSSTFNGKLDEFRIWGKVLGASTYSNYKYIHFNSLLDNDIIRYWDFNEAGTGVNAEYYDITGYYMNSNILGTGSIIPFSYYEYPLLAGTDHIESYHPVISAAESKTYYAQFYDGISWCTDSVIIGVAHEIGLPDTITACNEGNVLLSTVHLFDNYAWSTGVYTSTTQVGETGQYSLVVADQNCILYDTFFVSVLNLNILLDDTTICEGDTLILNATSNVNNYSWNIESYASSVEVSPESTFVYTVTTTDGLFFCMDSVTVTVNESPAITIPSTLNLCNEDYVLIFEQYHPGYEYIWNTGDTSHYIQLENSGDYFLTVTDGFGCQNSALMSVNFVELDIIQEDTFICDASSLNLELVASVADFEWSTGEMTANIQVTPSMSTWYFVEHNGIDYTCTDSVYIEVADAIVSGINDTVASCDTTFVLLNANPGYNNYQWSNGISGEINTIDVSGIYYLTVTNSIGCVDIDTVLVSVIDAEIIIPAGINCPGDQILISTETNGYDFSWSTGDTDPIIFIDADITSTYNLTVSDGFATCYYSAQLVVSEVNTGQIYGPAIVDPDTIPYLYYVNANAGSTYQWFVSGGVYDPQDLTNDSIYISWTTGLTGFVSVTETNTDGCEGESVDMDISILSLDELDRFGAIQVYPNPTKGIVYIEGVEAQLIEVFTLSAQKVQSERMKSMVDLSGLETGIYILKMSYRDNVKFVKIIKD